MQANFILPLQRDFSKCRHVFCRPLMFQEVFGQRVGKTFILQCLRVVVKAGVFKTVVSNAEQRALLFSRWSWFCAFLFKQLYFLHAFKNLSGYFAKKLFLDFKHFLFLAFFPIKCCLFRLITALSRFFYFFLLTQPCFYLLSKNLSGCFAKNFFSFVNFSFFRRFSQRTVARFR